MTKIDHIALISDDPIESANWYAETFGAKIIYADNTWSFVEMENIKIAFVTKGQHPPHFAIEVDDFEKSDKIKKHRDGSTSVYKKDPWGNIYELIRYPCND
jgi:catechol 2,3-dioxygenase-like lactoylglutathione lyase family enzyme